MRNDIGRNGVCLGELVINGDESLRKEMDESVEKNLKCLRVEDNEL